MSETDRDTLLQAVCEHLKDEVMPKLEGFDAFGVRVAANALNIVQRELAMADQLAQLEQELARYVDANNGETTAVALAKRLRDRDLKVDDTLLTLLRRRTLARIAVDNPKYSGYREAQRRWQGFK